MGRIPNGHEAIPYRFVGKGEVMLVIGEKINSTRKSIGRAVEERNAEIIREEAVRQVQAGAHTLDVNCGTLSRRRGAWSAHLAR